MKNISTTLVVALTASVALTGLGGYVALNSADYGTQQNSTAQENSLHEPRKVEYTLVAENTTLEIAPGVRVQAWTYNGTIPGPVLRATEGDRVVLHFVNKTPMSHTIHLHGDHDEKDDGVFQVVLPGKSYTYDFTAGPPGALMYHCHVMPVTEHIRMGLYGALIVDPRQGLSPAREYVLVAGEYDTKDQLTNNPEYVFFNGYADQYWENPLPVRTNETVRVYYVNMGTSPAYGFHIHGTIFKAYASGIWDNNPVHVQTWEVAAGNGAIFEARWPWEGRYLFHLHGLPEEKGTMAYFNVTNAKPGAVDGVDVAKSKSISMIGWQEDLARRLQKQDPLAKINAISAADDRGAMTMADSTSKSQTGGSMGATEVSIEKGAAVDKDKGYAPVRISVRTNDTVTWSNDDSAMHTVDSQKEGLFSSGLLSQKRTFAHTFEEKGTYEYHCSLHPWMEGTVTVE
jgi:nitrite reductase (NO-forming)